MLLIDLFNYAKFGFKFDKYGYEDRRQASMLDICFLVTVATFVLKLFSFNMTVSIFRYLHYALLVCLLCKLCTAFLITLSKYRYISFVKVADKSEYVELMSEIKSRRNYGAIGYAICFVLYFVFVRIYNHPLAQPICVILIVCLFITKLFYQKNSIVLCGYLDKLTKNYHNDNKDNQ